MNVPEHTIHPPYLLGAIEGLDFYLRELSGAESPITTYLASANMTRKITALELTLAEGGQITYAELSSHGVNPHSLFELFYFLRMKMNDIKPWKHFLPGTLPKESKNFLLLPIPKQKTVKIIMVIGHNTLADEFEELLQNMVPQ